jgi:hypothetical protein
LPYLPPPKKAFDYSELVTGALRLVWRHKYLWFFGLFAGTGTSLGGWNFGYSGNFSNGNTSERITDWIHAHLTLIVTLALAAFTVAVILWLWSIICQGAVIRTVRDIRQGETTSFGSAFRRGRDIFGRLLLFYLLLALIFFGIGIIVTALIVLLVFLAATGDAGAAIVALVTSVLGLMAVGLMISSFGYLFFCTSFIAGPLLLALLLNYAIRALVLENRKPVRALRRGFRVLVDNLSRSLLLFLMSMGLSIAAAIGIIFALTIAAVPAGLGWLLAYGLDFSIPAIIIASLLSVPFPVVAILGAAISNTYFTVYWTDAYLMLTDTIDAGTRTEKG